MSGMSVGSDRNRLQCNRSLTRSKSNAIGQTVSIPSKCLHQIHRSTYGMVVSVPSTILFFIVYLLISNEFFFMVFAVLTRGWPAARHFYVHDHRCGLVGWVRRESRRSIFSFVITALTVPAWPPLWLFTRIFFFYNAIFN